MKQRRYELSWSEIETDNDQSAEPAWTSSFTVFRDVSPMIETMPTHEVDTPRTDNWYISVHPKYPFAFPSEDEWLSYRLLAANAMLIHCVEINPKKRGGIPVIRGTRFTASQVLAELADGRSIPEICDAFHIDSGSVVMFIETLSIYLDRPAPYAEFSVRRMLK